MKSVRIPHRISPPRVLNVGSGAQLLERELIQTHRQGDDPRLLKEIRFFTVDIAQINKDKLKAQKHRPAEDKPGGVFHVQADSEALPFRDGDFGMLVSNMAIDMMPRTAFAEASRVLTKGGKFIFTFHHPDMMRDVAAKAQRPSDRIFTAHLLQNKVYFETEDEIRSTLTSYGLEVEEIRIGSNAPGGKGSTWWFVEGFKK